MCQHDHPPIPPRQNRRNVLKGSLAGALAVLGLSMKGTVLASEMSEADTPGVTEGPYWVDEMLFRSDVRSDPTTGTVQVGLPLALAVNVSELNADGSVTPLPGAFVDIWHCNASGVYSDIASENSTGQQFLRGYQVTNTHGNVKFMTIYPGWYSGRTPHIHARVRVYDTSTSEVLYNLATQFFFDDAITADVYQNVAPYNTRTNQDTTNVNDSIYNGASNDGSPATDAGQYLMLRLAENRTRATASFNIVIDLTNTANEDTGFTGPTGGDGGGTPPTGGGGTPPTGGGGTPPTGTPPGGGGGPGGPPPGMSALAPEGGSARPAAPALVRGLIPSKASLIRA